MNNLWKQPNKNTFGNRNPNWKGGKIKHICKNCFKIYYKFPSQGNGRSKYCSKKCFYKRHPHNPVIDTRGYVLIYFPNHPHSVNGYIKEHRLKMEKKIRRFLKKKEVVHHINGIKSD